MQGFRELVVGIMLGVRLGLRLGIRQGSRFGVGLGSRLAAELLFLVTQPHPVYGEVALGWCKQGDCWGVFCRPMFEHWRLAPLVGDAGWGLRREKQLWSRWDEEL